MASKQKGGKLLGMGTYGCVFDSPVRCVDKKTSVFGVGKIFRSFDESKIEYIESQHLQAIDPNGEFTIPLVQQCITHKTDLQETEDVDKCSHIDNMQTFYSQLVYKNKGTALNQLFRTNVFDHMDLASFLGLLQGLKKFISNNKVHRDIKRENIVKVASEDDNRFRFIDFGFMIPINKLYAKDNDGLIGKTYIVFPPEYRLFYEMENIANYKTLTKSQFHNMLQKDMPKHASAWIRSFKKWFSQDDNLSTLVWLFSEDKKTNWQWIESQLHSQFDAFLSDLKAAFSSDTITFDQRSRVFYGLGKKFDMYSLGLTILLFFVSSKERRMTDDAKLKLKDTIKNMIHMNPFQRISVDSAITDWKAIQGENGTFDLGEYCKSQANTNQFTINELKHIIKTHNKKTPEHKIVNYASLSKKDLYKLLESKDYFKPILRQHMLFA